MDTQNVDKKSSQEGSRGHNSSQSDLEIDVFKRDVDMDVKEPVDRALYAIRNDVDDEGSVTEMKFPGSTYTLLFTSPIMSIPFIFASMSTSLCYICLLLSLFNLFSESSPDNLFGVPAGVKPEVRGAQYVGVLVGVLMEEEVPDAIQLFRTFSKESLNNHVPKLSYKRFIISCLCRIVNGYLYLLSVFLVIVQAYNVLDIFYDLLALQFVQSIDDVSFNLARKEMFGARLFAATNHDQMIQQAKNRNSCLKRNFLLKSILLINLVFMYIGLIYVTLQQSNGAYVCPSISINFGDEVWEEALIHGYEQPRFLEYAYFSGTYKVEGNFNGRPRYVEKNKWNGGDFATTVGAEIIFCKESGRWVFTHGDIYKHISVKIKDEDGCGWLIQSDVSVEYDLANIETNWMFWTGSVSIGVQNVEIVCNKCHDESDCNYQGICLDEGRCLCDSRQGSFGSRCELQTSCDTLFDDYQNRYDLAVNDGVTYMSYERNIYFQTFRAPNDTLVNFPSLGRTKAEIDDHFFINDMNDTSIALVYSGSRWFGVEERSSVAVFSKFNEDFHAFWMDFFSTKRMLVSEPTFKSSPVGVDFKQIINGEGGKEYGPYGRLKPLALYEGDGFFHCMDD